MDSFDVCSMLLVLAFFHGCVEIVNPLVRVVLIPFSEAGGINNIDVPAFERDGLMIRALGNLFVDLD